MKKQFTVIGLALFVMFAALSVPGDDAALTNKDIIRLTQAGLGASVLIAKIRASATRFDTSVEQLIALKEADVEDIVIAAMVDKRAAADGQSEDSDSFIITYPARESTPASPAGPAAPATGAAPQTAPVSPATSVAPAVSASLTPAAGSSFRDTLSSGGEGPEMVVIPAGRFRIGCVSGRDCYDSEKPVHEVVIARPFALSKFEVTFEDYDRFTYPSKVDDEGWGRGRRPVINVSWDDATEYAAWLSAETGKNYRLPTEAEWEYAARAGTTTKYPWGNDIGTGRANCFGGLCGDQWERTAPAGSFVANAWGLHDMHGNVWEWVQDCWNGSYAGAPSDGSVWTSGDCSRRVIRGGSWDDGPRGLRSADRSRDTRSGRFDDQVFRLAQDL